MCHWVSGAIWHQLCDVTQWIQLLCNLATLQPILQGAAGGQSSDSGGAPLEPPLFATVHSANSSNRNESALDILKFTIFAVYGYVICHCVSHRLEFFENNFTVSLGVRSPQTQHHGSTPKGISHTFCRNRGGVRKSGFQRTKALISLKCGKITLRLLLRINGKSYTRFLLMPKSTTLDDLEGSLCTLFQNTCSKMFMLSFIYF